MKFSEYSAQNAFSLPRGGARLMEPRKPQTSRKLFITRGISSLLHASSENYAFRTTLLFVLWAIQIKAIVKRESYCKVCCACANV